MHSDVSIYIMLTNALCLHPENMKKEITEKKYRYRNPLPVAEEGENVGGSEVREEIGVVVTEGERRDHVVHVEIPALGIGEEILREKERDKKNEENVGSDEKKKNASLGMISIFFNLFPKRHNLRGEEKGTCCRQCRRCSFPCSSGYRQ